MKEIRIPYDYAIFLPTKEKLEEIKEALVDDLPSEEFAELDDEPLALVHAYCQVYGVDEFIDIYCHPADPCGDPVYGPEMGEK